jgi:hypothetical protein
MEPSLYATRSAVLEALRAGDPETLAVRGGTRPEEWRTLSEWLGLIGNNGDAWVESEMARLERTPMRVRQLAEMLRYGGGFSGSPRSFFCAPYWWARRPALADLPSHLQGDRLPWAVIVPETVVRAQPSPEAPVLHTLTLELIRVLEDEPADAAGRFVTMQLGDRRGFVERAAVRNLADKQHACFVFSWWGIDDDGELQNGWHLSEIEY